MRFFRGISVSSSVATETVEDIKRRGLDANMGTWRMTYSRPGLIDDLFSKDDLSCDDTRACLEEECPAVCACGELGGALYYGLQHNRTRDRDTPIIIEFEAEVDSVAVDGKDFLYTAFQIGDPNRAGPILYRAYGREIRKYAEKAWRQTCQDTRIALCDLAVYDSDVARAHHASKLVLRGRHGTTFRNAFIVKLPIASRALVKVWIPSGDLTIPSPQVSLRDLLTSGS